MFWGSPMCQVLYEMKPLPRLCWGEELAASRDGGWPRDVPPDSPRVAEVDRLAGGSDTEWGEGGPWQSSQGRWGWGLEPRCCEHGDCLPSGILSYWAGQCSIARLPSLLWDGRRRVRSKRKRWTRWGKNEGPRKSPTLGGANDKAGQTSPLWGLAFGTSVCWSAQLFCPSGDPEDQHPKLQPSQTPAELCWGLNRNAGTKRQKNERFTSKTCPLPYHLPCHQKGMWKQYCPVLYCGNGGNRGYEIPLPPREMLCRLTIVWYQFGLRANNWIFLMDVFPACPCLFFFFYSCNKTLAKRKCFLKSQSKSSNVLSTH